MSGRFQVRQIQRSEFTAWAVDDFQSARPVQMRAAPWVDVMSPAWLIGYVIPGGEFFYEFRHAPEDE